MKLLLDLFLHFAKVGLFTFGGGYAMIALIEDLCVARKKWITHEEMMNITVIAESTPGPIAINCATYVGYRQKGLAGALAATVGIVLPSFLLLFIISLFLDRIPDLPLLSGALRGIKLAVGVLILDAAVTMIGKMPKKRFPLIVMSLSFLAMLLINLFSWNFSSISLMLIAAAVSLTLFCIHGAPAGKGGPSK